MTAAEKEEARKIVNSREFNINLFDADKFEESIKMRLRCLLVRRSAIDGPTAGLFKYLEKPHHLDQRLPKTTRGES